MRISDWSSDVCSSDLNDGMATKTLLESFRYPRQGPGMMWEAARDYVVKGGNQVLMGHALKQLTCDQVTGRWKVAAETLSDETITINPPHVIYCAHMRDVTGRIHPLPVTIGHALDLKYRVCLTVVLMIKYNASFHDNLNLMTYKPD